MKMHPGRSRSGSSVLVGAGSSSSSSAGSRKRGLRGRAGGSRGSWDRRSGVLLIVRLGGESEDRIQLHYLPTASNGERKRGRQEGMQLSRTIRLLGGAGRLESRRSLFARVEVAMTA